MKNASTSFQVYHCNIYLSILRLREAFLKIIPTFPASRDLRVSSSKWKQEVVEAEEGDDTTTRTEDEDDALHEFLFTVVGRTFWGLKATTTTTTEQTLLVLCSMYVLVRSVSAFSSLVRIDKRMWKVVPFYLFTLLSCFILKIYNVNGLNCFIDNYGTPPTKEEEILDTSKFKIFNCSMVSRIVKVC